MNSKKLSSFYSICDYSRMNYNIIIDINTDNEIQGGVSSVDYFVLSVIEEGALIRINQQVSRIKDMNVGWALT